MNRVVLVGAVWLGFGAVSGCVSVSPELTPHNPATDRPLQDPPSPQLMSGELTELRSLADPSIQLPVGAVAIAPKSNEVVGYYPSSGSILTWPSTETDNQEASVARLVGPTGLAFSQESALLLAATHYVDALSPSIDGIGLWDFQTGELVRCISLPCDPNSTASPTGFRGVELAGSEDGAMLYTDSSIVIIDGDSASGRFIANLDTQVSAPIIAVAVGHQVGTHAILFADGEIWLSNNAQSNPYRTIRHGDPMRRVIVVDAKIDRQGSLLAFTTLDEVFVINTASSEEMLRATLDNPTNVAFGQAGDFVLVTSRDRITMWDTSDFSHSIHYATPGISAVSIAEDDQQLIWGDQSGTIHIWSDR